MTNKLKQLTKVGILFLTLILLFNNCEKDDQQELTFDPTIQISAQTVSFEEAKNFFYEKQKQLTYLNKTTQSKKTDQEPDLKLTPDWDSMNQNPIFNSDALLTKAEVMVNRTGNYESQLYFVKQNEQIKNVIFTIFKEQVDDNGDVIDAYIFFNELDGTFMDGYKIENGHLAKKLVPKNERQVQKASFFMLIQSDPTQLNNVDFWCDNGAGGQLDEVVVTAHTGSGGGSTGNGFYGSLGPRYGNYGVQQGPSGGGVNPNAGRGGVSDSDIASGSGALLLNPITLANGEECPLGYKKDRNGSCVFEDAEFSSILEALPNAKIERYLELKELIKDNPWALIQDCAEQNGLDTSNYLDLYDQTIPQECSDRLFNLGVEWHHQPITDGNVPLANVDYYGVEVTNYPDFNNDGNPDSEAEMYQAFREKFTDFGSGELQGFQFSCDIPFNSTDTGNMSWEFIPLTTQDGLDFVSNDPIASILLIEADAEGILPTIAEDDGAVIVSDFTANDWTISTIMTANNGTQPFSGNRQWGWIINQNGNFEFFTRAVDVANISILLNIGANTECQQETYYDVAEATWENMQQEIVDWINSPESNGGQASIIPKTAIRVDKEKIEELLTSNETIDQINCD